MVIYAVSKDGEKELDNILDSSELEQWLEDEGLTEDDVTVTIEENDFQIDSSTEIDPSSIDEILEVSEDKLLAPAFFILITNHHYNAEEAADKARKVELFHGDTVEYARDYLEGTGQVPKHLERYIDYDLFAHDLERDGLYDFYYGGKYYVVLNDDEL